jgi:lambda repressor-like predicted transcriptional regulator
MATRSSGDDFRYQYYLAQAIRVEGVVRGWSLRELAVQAGVDYQSLLRKVNLERHFLLPEIEKVSAALRLTPSALLLACEARRANDPHSEGHDRIERDSALSRKMRNEQHALLERVTSPSGDISTDERRLG